MARQATRLPYAALAIAVAVLPVVAASGGASDEAKVIQPMPSVTLQSVRSQRVHYSPGQRGDFVATVTNAGAAVTTGRLVWQVVWDLEQIAAHGEEVFAAPAGGETTVAWSAVLGRMRYGGEVRAFLAASQDDVRSAYFGVSADVGTVGLLGGSHYANYTDQFAWAPDDFGNLSPAEEEWWAGQVGRRYNRAALKKQIEDGQARGIHALTYVKGVSGGRDGIRLLLRHPEWAAFNRFGQLGGLDMSFDVWALKHWDDADRKWGFWNSWTPNFMSKETVRYGADAIVKSVDMFGWDGLRFDAQFDIFGGYDIAGRALPSGAARDAVNARNVTLMKDRVRRRQPHFTFGYNYGLPMPIPSALDQAVCAGGGLVMDEGIRNASDPQHPLQDWRRYSRHILEESASVRSLGGVPLIFGSGLRGVAADYGIGFCLAGGGTPYAWDFAQTTRAYDAFATRHSELLWNADYHFIAQPETALAVSAASGQELWWRDWVRSGRAPDGTPRLIVHLFNPPPAPTLRAVVEAPPPAAGVRVTLRDVKVLDVGAAWWLTCDRQPRVQRLAPTEAKGACVIDIGAIEHWGILVLDGAVAGELAARLRVQPLPDKRESRIDPEESKPLAPPLDMKPFVQDAAEEVGPSLARELQNGRIVLANGLLRFEIDPRLGGRVASFVDRRDGLERVVPGRLQGMFFDTVYDQDGMLYQGQWGVNQAPAYKATILEAGPESARVVVSREAFAAEHGVPNENYSGLLIEREFVLTRNAATLECIVRLRNTAAESRCPAYALRHGYVDGAQRDHLRYYRPSRRGIHVAGPGLPETDPMIWDPAAGWTATADAVSGRGAAWLMDAGRVMMFYNSTAAVTGRLVEEFPNRYGVDPLWIWDNASDTAIGADWYYRRAFIPPGGVWETRVTLIPLQHARGAVAQADPHAVVTVDWPQPGAAAPVRVGVLPSALPFTPLRASLELGSEEVALSQADGGGFAGVLTSAVPAVVHFRIEGKDGSGAVATVRFPYVPVPARVAEAPLLSAPAQQLDYGPAGTPPPVRGPRTHTALVLEGLGFERWGVAAELGVQGVAPRSSEFMKRRIASAVRYLPASLQEAQRFDLIVLGGVDAFALSHEGVAILKDYVRSGGALLVLGGLYGYGGGRFQEFGLDELLPLRVKRTFDLIQPDGRAAWDEAAWKVAGGAGASPALGRIAWTHDVDLASGATVWVRIRDLPLVAVSNVGRGRVVAVAAAPLGDPDAAGAFWQRPAWTQTLGPILGWLLKQETGNDTPRAK